MFRKKTITGSVLATVLVVATLMLLAILALLSLTDIEAILYYGSRSRKQKQAWLDAAFLLYERDSLFQNRLDEEGSLHVFEDDPRSKVRITSGHWGLYELVSASTEDGKIRGARLMGLAAESRKKAALYVCDNRMAFTLAGKSEIRGVLYLPEGNLLYGQVQSDFYSGQEIPASLIRSSSPSFPGINRVITDSLRQWNTPKDAVTGLNGDGLNVSFFDPPQYVHATTLYETLLQGHIILTAPDQIEIDSTTRLQDVLVIAPKVTVRSGFAGSAQIIATDTVIVEPRVRLQYPSGIIIPEAGSDSYIEIAEQAEVNGYVIFNAASEVPEEKTTVNYQQREKARVRGLVWCDGIAEIHGTVTGSLYVNRANYYTPQGYYMNLLYNASVYGNNLIAYPVWMESHDQRKTVKWLH